MGGRRHDTAEGGWARQPKEFRTRKGGFGTRCETLKHRNVVGGTAVPLTWVEPTTSPDKQCTSATVHPVVFCGFVCARVRCKVQRVLASSGCLLLSTAQDASEHCMRSLHLSRSSHAHGLVHSVEQTGEARAAKSTLASKQRVPKMLGHLALMKARLRRAVERTVEIPAVLVELAGQAPQSCSCQHQLRATTSRCEAILAGHVANVALVVPRFRCSILTSYR